MYGRHHAFAYQRVMSLPIPDQCQAQQDSSPAELADRGHNPKTSREGSVLINRCGAKGIEPLNETALTCGNPESDYAKAREST